MSPRRLLLADDSVTIQKVVKLTFADEGVEVVAVGDGDAVMQSFVEAMPDLVMVDVNMPGLDGYRICEIIKQDDDTKHIPVILLVGSFEPFDEEEARRVGADDFLTKPFQSIRQLVTKVTNLLNGRTSDALADDFDDTLKMSFPAEDKETLTEDFGNVALDDEMIQTSQIGSLPVDEASKFESPASFQPPEEIGSSSPTETIPEHPSEIPPEEDDWTEEQTSSENNSEKNEDASTDDEVLPRHENIYDFANEQEFIEDDITLEGDITEEFADEFEPLPFEQNVKNAADSAMLLTRPPVSNFDEFDLLEVPPTKKIENNEPEFFVIRSATSGKTIGTGTLSPEEIEAVADKVIEKLSDNVIKKIVREVFLQMKEK